MVLVDRFAETGVMNALLDGVRESSSGVLVLEGQAGIGKTALLREIAERAASGGMRIARAVGIQTETEFDFAGLHQLLLPFAGGLEHLPGPQRTALGTVFGLATGQASDRFLVGLATLTLLTDAAESQPVLCVVDDAQWLDHVSLEVVAFVARRLLADRVGMVFGVRAGEERAEALGRFPNLHVGPLPPEAGRELLEMAAGGPGGRIDISSRPGGGRWSPARAGRAGQRAGRGAGVPDAIPGEPLRLGERLELLYLDRVRELPSGAQTLLVLAAAEQSGESETVQRAAEALGVDLDALAEQATPDLTQPLMLARARRVHGLCLQAQGLTAEAVRTLIDAALGMGTADPGRARDTMLEAFSAAQLDGWFGPENAEVARAVRRLPAPPAGAPGDGLLEGFAAIHEGRTAEGYALLREGVRSLAAARDSPDNTLPRLLAWLQAAGLLFDHSAWADLEQHWVPALRERGAVTTLIPVLFSLAHNHLRAGRLPAAETALAEGRTLAEGVDNREWLDGFSAGEVVLLALRGDVPEGRTLAARLLTEPMHRWRLFVFGGL